jgi:hypothetical protein
MPNQTPAINNTIPPLPKGYRLEEFPPLPEGFTPENEWLGLDPEEHWPGLDPVSTGEDAARSVGSGLVNAAAGLPGQAGDAQAALAARKEELEGFTRAATRAAGAETPVVEHGAGGTVSTLRREVGSRFDRLQNANTLRVDPQLALDLLNTHDAYR